MLFWFFFSLVQWTSKKPERQEAAERVIARAVAYPICAFIVLLPYVFKDCVPEELSDALFLASVIVCRVTVFIINHFWVPNAIKNSFKFYIYGFILAFALITLYYEGCLPALPIFVYVLSFYIDFDFGKHIRKRDAGHNGKKKLNTAIKHILRTIRKEYLPAIINCIAIILAFIFIPTLDNFVQENLVALGLPWLVLTPCYIFAIIYAKKRKKQQKIICKKIKKH